MRRLRLIVLLAALAGVAAFVAPLDGGRPLLDFGEVKGKLRGAAAPASRGEEGGAYKWRDEDGTWHFSNVRPEGRRGVQKVKEAVTWATGPGAAGDPAAAGDADPDRPRDAAELLAESRSLEGTARKRETEMEKLVREAQE
ncbi:MAG TPA: DUF4124 domain-containing protein [Longimicrobiaceae bacterium]|nr:DUF4124 domain-containing protein [Longimicrobiaceae bacterium]